MKTFTLYKENRLDQKFQIDEKELTEKFIAFLKQCDRKWLEYYAHSCILVFITDKRNGGLNATPENRVEQTEIENTLEPVRFEYFKKHIYN